jgi:hypothetical protein
MILLRLLLLGEKNNESFVIFILPYTCSDLPTLIIIVMVISVVAECYHALAKFRMLVEQPFLWCFEV